MATTTTLAFTKNPDSGLYEASHSVSSSFAIHVECRKPGAFTVEQKSDPNAPKFGRTDNFSPRDCIDEQYVIELPAIVKITSSAQVTYATIIES